MTSILFLERIYIPIYLLNKILYHYIETINVLKINQSEIRKAIYTLIDTIYYIMILLYVVIKTKSSQGMQY